MHNWSTDDKKLLQNSYEYAIWRLEQMVNFGLDGGKLNTADLHKYWDKIQIDPTRRQFLGLLLGRDNNGE